MEDCSIPTIPGLVRRIGEGGYIANITTAFIEISRKLSDDIKAMMRLLNQSIFHVNIIIVDSTFFPVFLMISLRAQFIFTCRFFLIVPILSKKI